MSMIYSYHVYCILIAVSLAGSLSAAPRNDVATIAQIASTIPDPPTSELPCEMLHKSNERNQIKEQIQDLMGQYNNWGKLLAPAPMAIGILGQLILMANQRIDFPIDSDISQNKTFKYIKYPKSFCTTLLQISQSGYRAFLKAHTNMNAIRAHNSAVPSDIKSAISYLMSKNGKLIKLRLPSTLARILDATKKSQELSKEVINEFQMTLFLIEETELALSSSRRGTESSM